MVLEARNRTCCILSCLICCRPHFVCKETTGEIASQRKEEWDSFLSCLCLSWQLLRFIQLFVPQWVLCVCSNNGVMQWHRGLMAEFRRVHWQARPWPARPGSQAPEERLPWISHSSRESLLSSCSSVECRAGPPSFLKIPFSAKRSECYSSMNTTSFHLSTFSHLQSITR